MIYNDYHSFNNKFNINYCYFNNNFYKNLKDNKNCNNNNSF